MKPWSSQHYKSNGIKKGINSGVVNSALAHANLITSKNNNIIPIFTLKHLAYLTDVEYNFLRSVIKRNSDEKIYRFFSIKKKNSLDRRQIFVPHYKLSIVQKFINNNILRYVPAHECSFAYMKNISIMDAAQIHTNSRWLIKLDITNFFESISEISVYKIFRSLNYPALLSFELARICTWNSPNSANDFSKKRFKNYSHTKYSACYLNKSIKLGHLPQGAPTSPSLSNLVCKELDNKLANFAKDNSLEYTRYSDDLTFSCKLNDFTRKQAINLITNIYKILINFGFNPNRRKTKIIPPRSKKIVLGLNVDRNEVKLDKSVKNKIKQHIYFCLKPNIGPLQHARRKNFSSILGFKNHLHGLIMYANSIDKEFGQKMLTNYNKIIWPIS